ncbi:MAG: HNH endonuclease signature motif containing protein [Patescibacteria group bacterium]|jgi:hypothetical protein
MLDYTFAVLYTGNMRERKWTENDLRVAVKNSRSIRQILIRLRLREAGGNYSQIQKYIKLYNIDVSHLKGRGWNKGLRGLSRPRIPIKKIIVSNSTFQSYKLKNRLLSAGLKLPYCEECGWAKRSKDGRLPLEIDHINGNSRDNRLKNLRILCPNCHSLKPTHRGRNRR